MVTRQTIAFGQRFEQLPTETQTLRPSTRIKQAQGPLGSMDLPPPGVGIQKKMQQSSRRQMIR